MRFTVWNPDTGKIVGRGNASSVDEALAYELIGLRVKLGVALDPMTQAIDPATGDTVSLQTSAIPVTVSDVNVERDRRIGLGFKFRGKVFQADLTRIAPAMSAATAAVLNGATDGDLHWSDPDRDFGWIALDNTTLTMDARTVIMFGQAASAHVSAHVMAARAIKDDISEGKVIDINDDSLWPSRT